MSFNQKIKHLCTRDGILHEKIIFIEYTHKIFLIKERYNSKYKSNHKINDYFDCSGYTDGSAFSIVKIEDDKYWSIMHIPSESVLFSGVKRKRDAEVIMLKFKELSNENYDNLWIYVPDINLLSSGVWRRFLSAKEYFFYTRSFEFRFGGAK